MKLNKLFTYIAASALLFGSAACSDDDNYTAGPKVEGAQAYFPDEMVSKLFSVSEEKSISIPVNRVETEEALTLSVLADAGEAQDLFDIPASVTFAAGETTTDLVITFDGLEDGTEYPIQLMLNDPDNTTPYGNSQIAITVAPWPWEKLGVGKFRDDILTTFYGGTGEEIDVTIYKHKTREGIYMIEDMFGWNYLRAFFGGTQAQIEAKYYTYTSTNITINCADPTNCGFPRQPMGIIDVDPAYGAYEIATLQGGTLVDGIITFPTRGLVIYTAGSGYYGNTNGMFRIILPGYEAVDYSLAVAYAGMKVGADNQTVTPVFDFTYGADVTGIGYTFVDGDATAKADEYVAGIVDGSDENAAEVDDFEVGAGKVSISAGLKPGIYTLVAVPKDKNGAYVAASATAHQFYFPGIGAAEDHPCEVAVTLGKVSENASEFAEKYPDYSSIYYKITGTDIKNVKTYLNKTALIESVENGEMADDGLADLQDLMDAYGAALDADKIVEINEGGGFWNIIINRDAATSYTMLVEGENIYGEKKFVKSAPFTTDAMPYTGELILGDYYMSYTEVDENSGESYTSENVFTIKPTAGSDTKFFVSDFGIDIGVDWYAVYDASASTLTLSGVWKGNESKGSYLAKWVAVGGNQAVAILSSASEDSEGNDPIVIKIDSSTKQPVGLETDVEILLGEISDSSVTTKGLLGAYYADGTTIVPYVEEAAAAKASVKPMSVRPVKVPFSSVRVPAQSRKVVAARDNFASEMTMVCDTTAADAGRRTLSVKTAKCESLPKQLTRKADFKMAANAGSLVME